ncbi:MAG: hypothetical protein GY849_21070 [Deltaproteobacteria bacterium]|nr:hypothetical protein [Deltaproteobacteria bacterium]
MKKLFLILLIILFCSSAYGAGSCTTTSNFDVGTGLTILTFTWTSTSGGAVSSVGGIGPVTGMVHGVQFVPDGTAKPSALYDVTIVDGAGLDVLMAAGANLPQAATDTTNFQTPLNADSAKIVLYNAVLTPAITNAGDTKAGVIYLYIGAP